MRGNNTRRSFYPNIIFRGLLKCSWIYVFVISYDANGFTEREELFFKVDHRVADRSGLEGKFSKQKMSFFLLTSSSTYRRILFLNIQIAGENTTKFGLADFVSFTSVGR